MKIESRLSGNDRSVWLDELRTLLEGIKRTRSLNSAARESRIGYRRAWQILRDAAEITGAALVSSATGGYAGGGSQLTDHGRATLSAIGAAATPAAAVLGAPGRSFERLPAGVDLLIASSTEPVDSGLLNALCEAFSREHGGRAAVVSVGSGTALRMAVDGRVDLALTHAPDLEDELAAAGLFSQVLPVMKSAYAVICGSASSVPPRSRRSAPSVFQWIARHEYPFVSRGDQSGTHLRERRIWELLEHPTDRPWYQHIEPGAAAGTAAAVELVRGRKAYTFADRLAVSTQDGVAVVPLTGPEAENRFSFIVPAVPTAGRPCAQEFLAWVSTRDAAAIVRRFSVEPLTV